MPKVIADITMSLDGYVTGPGAHEQHGLGDAPELHAWVTEQDAVDTEIPERASVQSGAVVIGRRLCESSTALGVGTWTWGTARIRRGSRNRAREVPYSSGPGNLR